MKLIRDWKKIHTKWSVQILGIMATIPAIETQIPDSLRSDLDHNMPIIMGSLSVLAIIARAVQQRPGIPPSKTPEVKMLGIFQKTIEDATFAAVIAAIDDMTQNAPAGVSADVAKIVGQVGLLIKQVRAGGDAVKNIAPIVQTIGQLAIDLEAKQPTVSIALSPPPSPSPSPTQAETPPPPAPLLDYISTAAPPAGPLVPVHTPDSSVTTAPINQENHS